MILALDIASTTGWAVGEDSPTTGTIIARGELGQKLDTYKRRVAALVCEHNPGLIIFEQPIMQVVHGRGSSNVLRLALALTGITEMIAWRAQVPVREVPIASWRKHFIGRGRAPRGFPAQWCKEMAKQRCRQRGWGDLTHDEAEACGIWDYAMSLRNHKRAVQQPMEFGGDDA